LIKIWNCHDFDISLDVIIYLQTVRGVGRQVGR